MVCTSIIFRINSLELLLRSKEDLFITHILCYDKTEVPEYILDYITKTYQEKVQLLEIHQTKPLELGKVDQHDKYKWPTLDELANTKQYFYLSIDTLEDDLPKMLKQHITDDVTILVNDTIDEETLDVLKMVLDRPIETIKETEPLPWYTRVLDE